MNKKNPKDVHGYPLTIRLTIEEDKITKELRNKYNINISNLIRNSIKAEYEKILQRN